MSTEGFAAAWLIGAVAYVSHALSLRMLPVAGAAERWSMASVFGVAAAISSFQLLALFTAFRLDTAVALSFLTAVATYFATGRSPKLVARTVAADLVVAVRFAAGDGRWPVRLARCSFAALALSMLSRALILPPLGWDSITYHATKAAMWVQTGGALPFDLPGGWALYRHYPPGGEILGAWAMLPFHDDTLYLWVDVAAWLMWAPILTSLQRELGLPRRVQAAVTAYLMCVSSIYYFVPSGYVEPTLYLLIYAGVWLVVRALRGKDVGTSSALGTLSLATAATVKITALPFVLLGAAVLLVKYLRQRRELGRATIGFGVGLLLSIPTLGLMLLRNATELGQPLGPYPLTLFGLVLAEGSPQLAAYSEWLLGFVDAREALEHTWTPFGIVAGLEVPSLGPLTPLWVVGSVFGVAALCRRRPVVALFVGSVAVVQLGLFFSPGFEAVRVTHGAATGRFLHAFLSVSVMLTLCLPFSRAALRLLVGAMVLVASAMCVTQVVTFSSELEYGTLLASAALLLGGGLAVPWLGSRFGDVRVGMCLLVAPLFLLVVGSDPLRSVRDAIRYRAAEEVTVAHALPRDWVPAARLLDRPEEPLALAVTKGFTPAYNDGFTYFLLGRRLQNRLHYISVRDDGAVPEYLGRPPVPAGQLDDAAWTRRVVDAGIDYVVTLPPPYVERAWMAERPGLFREARAGRDRSGTFEVLPNRRPGRR